MEYKRTNIITKPVETLTKNELVLSTVSSTGQDILSFINMIVWMYENKNQTIVVAARRSIRDFFTTIKEIYNQHEDKGLTIVNEYIKQLREDFKNKGDAIKGIDIMHYFWSTCHGIWHEEPVVSNDYDSGPIFDSKRYGTEPGQYDITKLNIPISMLVKAKRLLGIKKKKFTENDVKKAFKALAKQYHPDLNKVPETKALEVMVKLNFAYNLLLVSFKKMKTK